MKPKRSLKASVKRFFSRLFFGRKRLVEARRELATARSYRAKVLAELIRRVKRFPELEVTEYDMVLLPKGQDANLNECPIGTWFRCKPDRRLTGITVIGQVVDGMDMFVEQWGSGMSVAARGINRYRVRMVELASRAA